MFVFIALIALMNITAAHALEARKIEIKPHSNYNGTFVLILDSDLLGPIKGVYVSLDEYCKNRLPTWSIYSAGKDYIVWRVVWKSNTSYTYYICYGDIISSIDPRDIFYIILPGASYMAIDADGDDTIEVNSTGIYVYARASGNLRSVSQSYDTGRRYYDTGVYTVYDFGKPVTPINATLMIDVYDSDRDTYYVYVYLDGKEVARYYQRSSVTMDLSGRTFQRVAVRVYDTERNDWVRAWGWFNATVGEYVKDYAAIELNLMRLAKDARITVTGKWLVLFYSARLDPAKGYVGLGFVNGPFLMLNQTSAILVYGGNMDAKDAYLGSGEGVFGFSSDNVWASMTGERYDEKLSIAATMGNYSLFRIYANASGYGNISSGLHLDYVLVTPFFEDYEIFIGPEYEVPVESPSTGAGGGGTVVVEAPNRELAVIASFLSIAGAMYFFAYAFTSRKLIYVAVYEALILASIVGLLISEQYKIVPWIVVLTMLPLALVARDLAEALSSIFRRL